MPHEDPHLSDPLIDASLKNWFRELQSHDARDVAGILEALGLVLILLSKKVPETRPALTDDDFDRKLRIWRRTLADLLGVHDNNGGAS